MLHTIIDNDIGVRWWDNLLILILVFLLSNMYCLHFGYNGRSKLVYTITDEEGGGVENDP